MSVTSTSSSSSLAQQTQSATHTGAPVPLVTQFSQPLDCSSLFTVASVTTSNEWDSRVTTSFLASDTANSRFSSCQPPGWGVSSHFTFSPGLCPSGWNYWDLHAVTTRNATESQAYCCPETFQLQDGRRGGIQQCTSMGADDSTHTRVLAHQAWLVKWQPSDNLPISLPDLPSGSTAREWSPGQSIMFPQTTTATYVPQSNYGNDLGFGTEYLVVVIVIPIVVFIILVVGCVFGCRYRKQHKRKMQEQLEQRKARAGATKTEAEEAKTAEANTAEVKTNVA